jgi:hypothetical protein
MEHLSPSQLKSLRDIFSKFSRRRGDADVPTIASSDLHRILQACGIRLTESDANALVLKADTTGSGSGLLAESDFLQTMTLALNDCDLGLEVDSLYDKIASFASGSPSATVGDKTVITLGALTAFLEQLRKQPAVGATVPPFTKAELAAFFADASTMPSQGVAAGEDDSRVLTISRDDFQRLMHLQISSAASLP